MKNINLRQLHQERKKYITKTTLGWGLFAVLVSIQIFFTIQVSSLGAELSVLESKSQEMVKKNQELKAALITKSSLSDANTKAAELGFIKPTNVLFVKHDQPVAQLR